MSDSNSKKTVSFGASDAGLSSFMKKMQADGKKLYSDFAEESKKQSKSAQEQNKFIQERIRLLREELKYKKEILEEEVKAARETVKRLRNTASKEGFAERRAAKRAMRESQALIDDVDDQERGLGHAAFYAKTPVKQASVGQSVFSATLAAGLVKDLLGALKGTASAQTGLDLISPIASVSGGLMGGTAGTAMDALNVKVLGSGLGNTSIGPILASLGKEAGAYLGDALTRSLKLKSEFDTSTFGYRAFTGLKPTVPGMTGMGYDGVTVASAMKRIAESRGGAGGGVENMLGLSRGFGVGEGTTLGAIGLSRMGGAGGLGNAQRGLGIAIAEGLNRSRFTDVIANQTAIIQEFAKTNNIVSNAQANKTMFEFNRMGGPFTIGDPRTMGNIGAIQEGLSNPGTAFGQAQNYAVLRRLNPSAGIWQIRKMQQQGLQTPGFLSGVLGDIMGGGGSEDFQKLQLMSRMPGLSMDAIDTFYKMGPAALGSMSSKDLNKMLGSSAIKAEGESNTSIIMRQTAEVTDAFRDNFIKGIDVITKQFVVQMDAAIDQIAKAWMEKFSGNTARQTPVVDSKTPIKSGAVRVQQNGKSYDYYPPVSGMGGWGGLFK